jgi:hypothetical protein
MEGRAEICAILPGVDEWQTRDDMRNWFLPLRVEAMARSDKTPLRRKPAKQPYGSGNRRLTEQNRKLLGKHYANKYRAGRRG